jgi:hypothetical protein
LAGLLTKVLAEYQKAHPATTSAEIRAAVRLAQASAGPDRTAVAAGLSVALGLGVLALTLGLFFFRSAGDVEIGAIFPAVIAGLIVVIGLVAVMVKMKS